jgi:hypothetical protein
MLFPLSGMSAGRSTIENASLVIPRVDVDGYGALALSFTISYDTDYRFSLTSATEASLSVDNAAVFDPSVMEIEIFEIELANGDLYTARLGLIEEPDGMVFELIDAQPLTGSPTAPSTPVNDQAVSLYGQLCVTCHGNTGQGTSAGPPLVACANCGSHAGLAAYIRDTMPLGQSTRCDTGCAALLSDYILGAFNSSNQQVSGQAVGFIKTLSATETVRKAGMELLSRFPTLAEFQLATSGGDGALRQVIDGMMEEPAFYARLSEIFNDYLLTDKYLSTNGSDAALRLLDSKDFPALWWFDPGKESRPENFEYIKRVTNDGVAREPLELINHIVRNNRPFTEIVTANYFMVNPFSARSYGVPNTEFHNPEDPKEFQPAVLTGIPTAGILTSPMFLNRYPTTATNRNRGRARVVFDLFLDTDILAIEGVRPGNAVDITNAIPTIDNPECSKCHSVLDPVASVFQNWDYKGRFRPARLENGWYADMELRGFNGVVMPLAGNVDSSVRWLGRQIAQDPKFPRAVVRILVNGLTGKEPLPAPPPGAAQAEVDAYVAERTLLNDIQQKFVADNYNLKTLVREILMSPYWRAAELTFGANLLAHADTGSRRMLTPEQLDRKITTLLGFEWRGTMDNYYKEKNQASSSRLLYKFHQIYGGIDSDDVTTRLKAPNGMMGAMQLRMANELACYAVPQDFLNPSTQRRLFPFVEAGTSPYDANGVISPQNMQLIRENIRYLHDYLLRENYHVGSPELQVTEDLFMSSINQGRQHILTSGGHWSAVQLPAYCKRSRDLQGNSLKPDGGEDRRLLEDRQFVIRSWMAVLAYLLSDYHFVYE